MASTSGSQSASPGQTVICVYCGSKPGSSPAHLAAARSLAQVFHEHNIKLVYGGGTSGMMGEISKTLVALSGPDSVHGIIPATLMAYEQDGRDSGKPPPSGVDENVYGRMTVVTDMHTRKSLMADQVKQGGPGSGFVALSGGYGTLEELMEVTTWNQLGIQEAGVCIFNVEGFWDGLLGWLGKAVEQGFVTKGSQGIIVEAKTAAEVVKKLSEYQMAEGRFNLDWNQK